MERKLTKASNWRLVCKPKIHKRTKEPVAPLFTFPAVQRVSAVLQNTSTTQNDALSITMRAIFNIKDANDDHLASFSTSTSTVYSHVLVLT